jgi:hypothetical protein
MNAVDASSSGVVGVRRQDERERNQKLRQLDVVELEVGIPVLAVA